MKIVLVLLVALVAMASARPKVHLTLYEHNGYRGRQHHMHQPWNVQGFNDKASSFHAHRGNWDCFEHGRFEGHQIHMRDYMPGPIIDLVP